jgi:hypothetical protein
MLAACSGNEDKWEPEVAVSLAFFEIDISERLPVDTFTIDFFTSILNSDELRKSALKRAIAAVDSLDKSVGDSLAMNLRGHWYNFPHDQSPTGQGAPIGAETFLNLLLPAFKEMKCFFAINYFAYAIVAEGIAQDTANKHVAEVLFLSYAGDIDFSETMNVDISEFSEKVEQIREVKLQFFMSSSLEVNADAQLKMLGSGNVPLDSFEARMPIADNDKNREPHVYKHDEAKAIIRSLNEIEFSVSSSSSGLTLEMLRDLHNRKINASVGLIVKMAINDNDAGQ